MFARKLKRHNTAMPVTARAAMATKSSSPGRRDPARSREGRERARARSRATHRRRARDDSFQNVIALALGAALALNPTFPDDARAEFYIEDVPSALRSSEGASSSRGEGVKSLSALTGGAKKKEVTSCVSKCVVTCARGSGMSGPGLGPASLRRDPVVFKEGFRSREYCLRECSEVCSRAINGDGARAK